MSDSDRPSWTDGIAYIRHHGQCVPTPADWVLRSIDGDGIRWSRFPKIASGVNTYDGVLDAFTPSDEPEQGVNTDALAEAEAYEAWLTWEQLEPMRRGDSRRVEIFELDGETLFRRVQPERDECFAAVAEILKRVSHDGDYRDVDLDSGEPHPEDVRQQEINKRREQNQQLTQWTDAHVSGGEDV